VAAASESVWVGWSSGGLLWWTWSFNPKWVSLAKNQSAFLSFLGLVCSLSWSSKVFLCYICFFVSFRLLFCLFSMVSERFNMHSRLSSAMVFQSLLAMWRFTKIPLHIFLLLNPPLENCSPSESSFVTLLEFYFDILWVWWRHLPFTQALMHFKCSSSLASADESSHFCSLQKQDEIQFTASTVCKALVSFQTLRPKLLLKVWGRSKQEAVCAVGQLWVENPLNWTVLWDVNVVNVRSFRSLLDL